MQAQIENGTVGKEARGESRRRLYLATAAHHAHGTSRAEILDLSSAGLMLSTEAVLEEGERLLVELADGSQRPAQVIWRAGRQHGCRFDTPLSRAELGANLLQALPPRETAGGADEPLGARLRRLRIASPHSMAALARLAGVTKPTLWKWETGRSHPRPAALARIAKVLGISEAELLYGRTGSNAPRLDGDGDAPPHGQTLAATVAEARMRIAAAAGVAPDRVSIRIEFS